jgi:hypothetical protein
MPYNKKMKQADIAGKLDAINETLQRIDKTLERQSDISQKALDTTPKPASRFVRLMGLIVLIAGAMGILNSIELIMRWITGG